MNALRDAELNDDQTLLLHTLGNHWHETGKWPLWGYIQDRFDEREGAEADTVLRSLPRIGADTPFGAGYGFTTAVADHRPIGETDTIRLTLAACYQLPEMIGWAGKPFVRTLQHMIKLWGDRPVSPGRLGKAFLSSEDLTGELDVRPSFAAAFPDLLSYEPAITTGNGDVSIYRGPWQREITRSVLQYRGVQDIHDYLDRTCEIVQANAARHAPLTAGHFHTPEPAAHAPADERAPYLDEALLTELEDAAQGTRWKVHKLLALCRELNSNFAARNPYACAALIRAVTDHIPPLFGQADFKQVAAQHVFAMQRTDKAHAQELVRFKEIAHDALHRPISSSLPLITMADLPAPARLRAVLHELVTVLTETGAS
ncbi:hypothetical protein ACFUT3_28015 [Streptomyces cinereoruber]|uniref:hypothetical protein n=1 Tax=Streptomyces cinereoruber TaxID=67260 RepID=UPI003630AAAC